MSEPPTFLDLLDRLTRDTPARVVHDDVPINVTQTGLLQQLREAVFGGMESTGGSSQFGSRPPIDASAVDLLNEITAQASEVLAVVSHQPTPYGHAEVYVRLWAGQTKPDRMFTVTSKQTGPYDPANPKRPLVYGELSELSAYNLLARWVERVEEFFNPPSTREIAAACPNCDARYSYRVRDGQHVRSAALNLIRDRNGNTLEAKCSVCTRAWPPTQFEFLAKLVGAKPLPEFEGEVA